MDERLLTPDEVAKRLRVKGYTVREWLRTGKLKGFRAGGRWRVREEDLEEQKELGLGYQYQGHAPGHIRGALEVAFDCPFADDKEWWQTFNRPEEAFLLLGMLWNCTDVVPHMLRSVIADWTGDDDLRQGCTYAQAARALKVRLSEVLEEGGRP